MMARNIFLKLMIALNSALVVSVIVLGLKAADDRKKLSLFSESLQEPNIDVDTMQWQEQLQRNRESVFQKMVVSQKQQEISNTLETTAKKPAVTTIPKAITPAKTSASKSDKTTKTS